MRRVIASAEAWTGALVCAAAGVALSILRRPPRLALPATAALHAVRAEESLLRSTLAGSHPRVVRYDDTRDLVVWSAHGRVLGQALVSVRHLLTLDIVGRRSFLLGSPTLSSVAALLALSTVFVLAAGVWPVCRVRNLDVLALIGLVISGGLYEHEWFGASVLCALPPLLYLTARCAVYGLVHPARHAQKATPLILLLLSAWPERARLRLLAVIGLALGLLCVLCATASSVVPLDVIYAAMEGATKLLHGVLPYGHLPGDVANGDTYPILSYAAYMPLAALDPVNAAGWSSVRLPLLFTAVLALAIAWVLWRQRPLAAVSWLAFPLTSLVASTGTTDVLLGLLLLLTVIGQRRAGASTGLLAAAAWFKLAPLALIPIWLSPMRGRRLAAATTAAGLVSVGSLGLLIAVGGASSIGAMLHALEFQFSRGPWQSFWVVVGLPWLQPIMQAVTLGLISGVAVSVARRPWLLQSQNRAAALIAAVVIALQLSSSYWSFTYVTWFVPLVLLALGSDPVSIGIATADDSSP